MDNQELIVLQELFRRYNKLITEMWLKSENRNNKCDANSLASLCEEAITNGDKYPRDKLHRWLGFVQGVLAAQGIIDVDQERDYTRPLFHNLYKNKTPSFDSSN